MAEGSSGSEMMMSFPSSLIPTLTPVVLFPRILPPPSTRNWSVKCLEGQGKEVLWREQKRWTSLTTGREFTEWVEFIFGISQEEYKILNELSPLSSLQMVASTDETPMAPILKLFNLVLTQLLTLVKKS
ncbi:hypothetical protein BYT27DRAFT_7226192 [Phlegmacium glaucopus]|nr:hypothetical protein BYT27DRAFT_7226192 [Phlegmacium glaucopus]